MDQAQQVQIRNALIGQLNQKYNEFVVPVMQMPNNPVLLQRALGYMFDALLLLKESILTANLVANPAPDDVKVEIKPVEEPAAPTQEEAPAAA